MAGLALQARSEQSQGVGTHSSVLTDTLSSMNDQLFVWVHLGCLLVASGEGLDQNSLISSGIGVGTGGTAGAAAPPNHKVGGGGYLFAPPPPPQLCAIELNSNFEIYVNFYK